jgi:hypothetical protein
MAIGGRLWRECLQWPGNLLRLCEDGETSARLVGAVAEMSGIYARSGAADLPRLRMP